MRNVVTISLSDDLLKKLNKEARLEKSSRSEIIKQSLSKYFSAHDFTRARDKAMGELARRGVVLTDEQVFEKVS